MYKKLARHGNSNALLLDKPILELLNITENTQLKITTDGTSLIITPVQHDVADQQSADSNKPFRDYLHYMQQYKPEIPQCIKDQVQNPTAEQQKQILDYMRKVQEMTQDQQFWHIRKEIMDAYRPLWDERVKALMKEFAEVDLKQFPEHVQKLYLETAVVPFASNEQIFERTNTPEYKEAMAQILPVLQAKFVQLYEEYSATHGTLRREMAENFAQARQELAKNVRD